MVAFDVGVELTLAAVVEDVLSFFESSLPEFVPLVFSVVLLLMTGAVLGVGSSAPGCYVYISLQQNKSHFPTQVGKDIFNNFDMI